MKCFACGGPYHPATGNLFRPDVAYCGRCYRHFLEYLKTRFYRRKERPDFIAEAVTSIRPPPTFMSP